MTLATCKKKVQGVEDDEFPLGGVIPLCAIEIISPKENKSGTTEKNSLRVKAQGRYALLDDDNAKMGSQLLMTIRMRSQIV